MGKKILSLFVTILLLSSCSPIHVGRTLFDDSHLRAEARLEELLAAIKDRDTEAVKALFSEKTVYDAVDFDESIKQLYDYIQGEIISWESTGEHGGQESNHYGQRTKVVNSYCYVDTNKEKYFFVLEDCFVDTENPDKVGYYLLAVAKEEEWRKMFDGDQKVFFDGDKALLPTGIIMFESKD